MNRYINKKNLTLLGIIVIIIFIIITQFLVPKKTIITESVPITPTPSIIEIQQDINPNETTEEWNKNFKAELDNYEKNRNSTAEATLSNIRLNSPFDVSGNIIKYDYKSATYTVTILNPYLENQNIVLSWLKQNGVDQNIIKTLRIKWNQQ